MASITQCASVGKSLIIKTDNNDWKIIVSIRVKVKQSLVQKSQLIYVEKIGNLMLLSNHFHILIVANTEDCAIDSLV